MTETLLSLQGPWAWATIIIYVGAVIGAVGVIVKFVPPAWRVVNRFVNTTNALDELPDFMATTKLTLAKQDENSAKQTAILKEHSQKLERIDYQIHENGGGSLKDAVVGVKKDIQRVEEGVAGLYDRIDKNDRNTADLRTEVENTRPPRKRAPKEPNG